MLEQNDFMPFGMQWQNPNAQISDNRWLYNGKEHQTVGFPDGTHFLDYGARIYDPRLARFLNPDPLADAQPGKTPFHFVSNNPVNRTDPTGMFDDWYLNWKEGELEQLRGISADLTDRGLERIAGDNASMGEIGDALTERGYDWAYGRAEGETLNRFHVDSGARYKAEVMMNTFSPDNVGTILGLSVAGGVPAREGARKLGASVAAKSAGEAATEGEALITYYPANNGFQGVAQRTYLMPGTRISRYGSTSGKFFSPSNTPLPMRALPSNANTNIYNTYKVLKPFEVQSGAIAPAFGQPGMGTQYLSPVSTEILLKRGIIGY